MKKMLFFVGMILMSLPTLAQDGGKHRELALSFNNLNFSRLGVIYRVGQPDRMWFFYLSDLSVSMVDSQGASPDSYFSGAFGLGRERRKEVANRVQFRYGWQLGTSYSSSQRFLSAGDELLESRLNTSFSALLGFNVNLGERFFLGVEALPGISFLRTWNKQTDPFGNLSTSRTMSGTLGLGLNATRITLGVRF